MKTRWWQSEKRATAAFHSLSRPALLHPKRLDFGSRADEIDAKITRPTIVESRMRCACLSAARIHKRGIGKRRETRSFFSRRETQKTQSETKIKTLPDRKGRRKKKQQRKNGRRGAQRLAPEQLRLRLQGLRVSGPGSLRGGQAREAQGAVRSGEKERDRVDFFLIAFFDLL